MPWSLAVLVAQWVTKATLAAKKLFALLAILILSNDNVGSCHLYFVGTQMNFMLSTTSAAVGG